MDLVDEICATVRTFPEYELFALNLQMRKAAVSIPCNIAEGHGRFSYRDFRHFLRQARGSGLELKTQIIIAKRQTYLSEERAEALLAQAERVGQLISGLIRHITKLLDQATENGERTTKNATPRIPTSTRR